MTDPKPTYIVSMAAVGLEDWEVVLRTENPAEALAFVVTSLEVDDSMQYRIDEFKLIATGNILNSQTVLDVDFHF